MKNPTISELEALDGKKFAMLDAHEEGVLNYYRDQGRKLGVTVFMVNDGVVAEIDATVSREHANQVIKRSNARVRITVAARPARPVCRWE